ncbi:DNA polymerase III subunit alpha [Kiloniella laminariae]|uniref:DNA polymerase III subunit alpha n=1 Tax=Kiloniella laminariae TaxID=454162 RepID=UPI00037A83E2|nr:DNA polymerase III subunit alpha [Kiloniella laminariae]
MAFADFVHLRVHTAYSLSEGAIKAKELVDLCKKHDMPAAAITDSSNLFGAMEFSLAAKAAGIQPILGTQIMVGREDRDQRPGALIPEPDQLVLLVQNQKGYMNLMHLISHAFMETETGLTPQISLEGLRGCHEGLIALTGGPKGAVGRLLLENQDQDAETHLCALAEIFPGRLYVELLRHGMPEERAIEDRLVDLAYKHTLPLVATNEAFFASEDMHQPHDALICIAEGAYVSQSERRRLTAEHRFKSADEMKRLFADIPEAIQNTLVIARRCSWFVEPIGPILPPFDTGAGRSETDELRYQSEQGLEGRLVRHIFTEGMSEEEKEALAKPYRERLTYELDVIIQMGFPGYFLIVADFIKWAKDHSIPVGPGRGSGAGSVVAWALTITDLDPLRWGLLFERFLNPERVSMPDFDVDFCQDHRDKVITYVQDKYGRDKVAQIITFGKLQARAALRDVGRVLQMPYPQVDRLCKLVPNNPAKPTSLPEAIAQEPLLREMARADENVGKLLEVAQKLEGLYRHASTHAAGVVIGDRPLDQLVPLYRDPRSDMPVTQFNMKFVEQAGLVKFDFLGLKTLTVLERACNFIRAAGTPIDLAEVPLDDTASFELLGRGDSVGVFQLESTGMRDVLKRLKPDRFEDIIAVVALYRPGPMENIPSYIRRKKGEETPDYMHPLIEDILKETYGIMIYQEQVMQIAQLLSGYSLGGADLLRRAMGKKIQAEMDAQRKIFVDGAVEKKVPAKKADEIFDQVNKFAGYGFNKSHAAAYALVAYHTAYLKANYPEEFMAATMTYDISNTDKLNVFRQELSRLNILLLPPDINKSYAEFVVETREDGSKAVRYAMAAVKNVGEQAIETITKERSENGPFKDLTDFVARVDSKSINKRLVENLSKAGAFDSLTENRQQVFLGAENIVRNISAAAQERASDQVNLFGGDDSGPMIDLSLPKVPDWPELERLKHEYDAIGFYLSAHPIDTYEQILKRLRAQTTQEAVFLTKKTKGQGGPLKVGAIVIGKQERTSKKGSKFAFIQISDAHGTIEAMVFSNVLMASRDVLESGVPMLFTLTGEVKPDDDEARFLLQAVKPLDEAASLTDTGLKLYISSENPLEPLKTVLEQHASPGRGKISLMLGLEDGQELELELPKGYTVSPSIRQAIKAIEGIDLEEV